MYIPNWLLILIIIAAVSYFLYLKKSSDNKNSLPNNKLDKKNNSAINKTITIEDIESNVQTVKGFIFEVRYFDSPRFIDLQNDFDTMEINYFVLKQRFIHNPNKLLEIAKDWQRYAWAVSDLQNAWELVHIGSDVDEIKESFKEPSIIKEEVEKEFKLLLGKDSHELKPDYNKRLETMKKPDKKTVKRFNFPDSDDWKYYYLQDENLDRLERKKKESK